MKPSGKNLFKMTAIAAVISFSSLSANAALYNRGNGMIYDSSLNITWLQDANYAKTSGYDTNTYGDDGGMTWHRATEWANNLVYGGFSDWRLPSAKVIGVFVYSADGSTDYGYNNTRSELGHLFAELGNKARRDTTGQSQNGYGWLNSTFTDAGTNQSVSFFNVQNWYYWQAEEGATKGQVFFFRNQDGQQGDVTWSYGYYSWAVRDGDVAAVPVTATAWLMGSGLIGLVGIARRKK